MGAQYVGFFSLLFFGGPLSVLGAILAWDDGPTRLVRFIVLLAAFVLGPLPVALAALLGRREIPRDPTLRGGGRLIFAAVTAALMMLALAAGGVGVLARAYAGRPIPSSPQPSMRRH